MTLPSKKDNSLSIPSGSPSDSQLFQIFKKGAKINFKLRTYLKSNYKLLQVFFENGATFRDEYILKHYRRDCFGGCIVKYPRITIKSH